MLITKGWIGDSLQPMLVRTHCSGRKLFTQGQTSFFSFDRKEHFLFIILFSTRYYYLAMAEDIIFRLLWVLGLVLKQVQHHYGPIDYDLSWILG